MSETVVPGYEDPELLRRIAIAAERNGLGAHRSAYPAPQANWRSIRITAAVFAGLVVIAVIGFSADIEALAALGLYPGVIAGFMLIIGGVRMLKYDNRYTGARLDLYERGLVMAYRGREHVARYDTVEVFQTITRHLRNGVHTHTTYHYRLTALDGTQVLLSEAFAGVDQWGPELQQAVTDAQLPVAAARVNAGERVDFGDLWITATEIGSRHKSAPWTRIESLSVRDGTVSIGVEGKWLNLTNTPVGSIPNYFVFYSLAEHLRRQYGPATAAR
ncbi:DUF6585 family protein [Nocardia inohanensis]|uniref:DUF6585 family protein n=1 Tax=Nocardia inohanensis TaxID=209246 RepID=UPI0008308FE2|nr:DUF6585 family protein [Nocardia inohanensis]